MGAAIRSVVQYLHLHDRGADLSLTVDEHGACVSYVVAGRVPGTDLVCDVAAATTCNVIQGLAGPGWRATEVLLPRTAPVHRSPFAEFFKAPIRFEAGIGAVVFAAGWLDRPVHTGNAVFRRLLEPWVTALDDRQPGRFHVHVSRTIRILIDAGKHTN